MVLYDECGFVGRSERVCTAQKLWWKEKEISGDSFLKKIIKSNVSTNSRGKTLCFGLTLRNFIPMRRKWEEQEEMFLNYRIIVKKGTCKVSCVI